MVTLTPLPIIGNTTMFTVDTLIPCASLCDMHDGLSVLESRIPGFRLLHCATIPTLSASDMVADLLDEASYLHYDYPFQGIRTNKILYLIDHDIHGNYKAIYSYDGRQFGIVTFRASI